MIERSPIVHTSIVPEGPGLTLSLHARRRMEQRGISTTDLDLVFQRAVEIYNGGALFLYMRRKDLPDSATPDQRERLEGLTLVISLDDGDVITAYKNKAGIRPILKKLKARRKEHFHPQMAA